MYPRLYTAAPALGSVQQTTITLPRFLIGSAIIGGIAYWIAKR